MSISLINHKWKRIKSLLKQTQIPDYDLPKLPRIAPQATLQIEQDYSFKLPESYKFFITEIGNGGLGIEPFLIQKNGKSIINCWGEINKDFKYAKAVYLDDFGKREEFKKAYLAGKFDTKAFVDLTEFDQQYFEEGGMYFQRQLLLFDQKAFYKSSHYYESLYEAFRTSSHHVDGSIFLESDGEGTALFLIIRGRAYGQIWIWDRFDGLYPFRINNKEITYFDDFLMLKMNNFLQKYGEI